MWRDKVQRVGNDRHRFASNHTLREGAGSRREVTVRFECERVLLESRGG